MARFYSLFWRQQIHHDRITFSLHEPTRGQTFKSVLKREVPAEEEKVSPATEVHPRVVHRKKVTREEEPSRNGNKKFHLKSKSKAEGKGIVKERNDSGTYANRRAAKNKIKVREDLSEDISD